MRMCGREGAGTRLLQPLGLKGYDGYETLLRVGKVTILGAAPGPELLRAPCAPQQLKSLARGRKPR